MELAWEHQRLTVKKALYYLGPNSRLAYTTVMTVLGRLNEKGLLQREKAGRTFEYSPVIDRKTFLEDRIRLVTDCLSRNFNQASGN